MFLPLTPVFGLANAATPGPPVRVATEPWTAAALPLLLVLVACDAKNIRYPGDETGTEPTAALDTGLDTDADTGTDTDTDTGTGSDAETGIDTGGDTDTVAEVDTDVHPAVESWSHRYFNADGSPVALEVADFDLDGDADVLTARGGLVEMMRNDGGDLIQEGDPVADLYWSADVVNMVAADVDGDGSPDLGMAGLRVDDDDGWDDYYANVLLNDGSGGFSTQREYGEGPELAIGDWTGDGAADLVFRSTAVQLGDFDADGDLDVAYAGRGSSTNTGVEWNTDSELSTYSEIGPGAVGHSDIVAADLNADGALDLAFLAASGLVWLFTNDGSGVFASSSLELPVPEGGGDRCRIRAGDLDGDGDVDLVAVSSDYDSEDIDDSLGGALFVLFNDGAAAFEPSDAWTGADAPIDLAIADIDGDGREDIVIADISSRVHVLSLP